MIGSALVLALFLLPFVGGVWVAFLRNSDRAAKLVALGFSVLELVLVVPTWLLYVPTGARLQLTSSADWIPAFGVHFSLGLDGIALVMIALIGLLVPIVIGAGWHEKLPPGRTQAGLLSLMLIMESFMIGVFAATDVFLFYVFFEAMLVPMYFLVGRFGGERRQYAAMKFFLYSLLGGLVMLASVIGLYVAAAGQLPAGSFDWSTLVTVAHRIPESTQIWLFLGFFLAFAIKAPLVPLHTWLPDAAEQSPVGVTVILVGVLDKVGTFGFLRYCLPLFPAASRTLAPLVLVLAVIGVLYGSLLAYVQTDMRRFVAYVSIAHFGFIALGAFAFSSQGLVGSASYMVNHGISTGMLIVVLGMVAIRGGSTKIADYGGMAKLTPLLGGMLLIAGLTTLSLPGTNSFISEFLVLIGSFPTAPVYSVLATIGMILAALYVLWLYQRMMTGPVRGTALVGLSGGPGAAADPAALAPGGAKGTRRTGFDLNGREKLVLAPLVVLVVLLGVYPKPMLDVITPSVNATLTEVGVTDPVSVGTGQEGK